MRRMDGGPSVSVCMPAHRDSEGFRAALKSVLGQPVESIEVIVTDDSGGGLRAAIEACGDERIRYVANGARLGLSGNHVAALELARGQFIAFLHDDDRWLPDYLTRALAEFAGDARLGMVCSDAWLDWGSGTLARRKRRPPPGRHERWLRLVMDHNVFIPSGSVVRRELWEAVSHVPWPDLVIGDAVFWIEAARTEWAMTWLDEPLFVYTMHGGQASARQELHRSAGVEIFCSYDFSREDPVAERSRRARAAHYLIGRAGLELRLGRPEQARSDLERARQLAPGQQRARRAFLTTLSFQPWLIPTARGVWRRVRRRAVGLDG